MRGIRHLSEAKIDASLITSHSSEAKTMIEELKAIIQAQDDSVPFSNDGPATFPDGSNWAFCSNWAQDLHKRLGKRVVQYGFSDEDNETSEIAQDAGGHDFAVVDGRYIVDGWLVKVEQLHETGVFDLEDETQFADITRLYGDPRCWKDGSLIDELDEENSADLRNQLAERFSGGTNTPTI
jgi:hypothetical protein